jgi:hypothetical protein
VSRAKGVPEMVGLLEAAGFRECPLDYFYDAQVTRRRHAARVALDEVQLSVLRDDEQDRFIAVGSLHVLLWSVGFMVLRLTFTDTGMQRPCDGFRQWFKVMHGLEHDFPVDPMARPCSMWAAEVGGVPIAIRGGVRRFFDAAGGAIHEILHERRVQGAAVTAWAASGDAAMDHAEDLIRRGELRYAQPVTFGSHSELIWRCQRTLPRDPDAWVPELIGSGAEGELIATNVDEPLKRKWWYISEFQSILVDATEELAPDGEVFDTTRAEMIEYIAYRRVGLMAIQRETSSITAERQSVAGARVADWMWLMSALTNDYVLGGWSGTMFARVRHKFLSFEGVRNLFGLEAQVENNIRAFQGRLDAESDRIGVITGVLFGIVAATALVPLGELFVIFVFGLGKKAYANFPDQYPLAFTGVIVGMLAVVGLISWQMLRHANSLRPPKADGVPRLRWRRKSARQRPGATT